MNLKSKKVTRIIKPLFIFVLLWLATPSQAVTWYTRPFRIDVYEPTIKMMSQLAPNDTFEVTIGPLMDLTNQLFASPSITCKIESNKADSKFKPYAHTQEYVRWIDIPKPKHEIMLPLLPIVVYLCHRDIKNGPIVSKQQIFSTVLSNPLSKTQYSQSTIKINERITFLLNYTVAGQDDLSDPGSGAVCAALAIDLPYDLKASYLVDPQYTASY